MAKADNAKLLQPGDLFDDVEVVDVEADELAHARIAEQLAELVLTVPAASNVALYGPWGSGKSGIGNLLRDAVTRKKGPKFARFDAYKYAETPLRRNFISAVATQLGITDSKYHADLYAGRTRTEIGIPASKIIRIILVFTLLLVGLSIVIAGILAIIAALQSTPFGESFAKLATQTATAALVPAALLSALITLSNKSLQVDRSLGKPDSDEQFESIFRELVASSKASRLVIFVDELDRCSADDVVTTLDAIRTFLGVDKCVFVIAADQQVLEESLTRAAKQETPANEVNPYYSTGSAYLDKVFQYQMSLPPLLSQRVTKFAADLVSKRGGLWSEIRGEYVVSVLVPTHVTSPRRVKHLLNAFALSYRLAQDRQRQGLLSEDPKNNAASLAKLICLRVEFPIFARDLEIDARLPQIVLGLMADPEESALDESWSAKAIERARAYATGDAVPTTLLADGSDDEDPALRRTAARSNEQLLDYLRRTKHVFGPTRDLVFMHSSGAAFGLDGQLALSLENAAENADVTGATEELRGADVPTLRGAIELLAHLMRTSVGVGAVNAAYTLLSLYAADPSLPVDGVADRASESISVLFDEDRQILDADTIEAGWNLAALGSSDGAQQLREAILLKAEDVGDVDATFILRNPLPALASNRQSLSRLASKAIVRDGGESSVEAVGDLSDEVLLDLLCVIRPGLEEDLNSAFRASVKATEAAGVSTSTSSAAIAATNVASSSEVEVAVLDPQPIVDALVSLVRERITNVELRQELVLLLLGIDRQPGRDAVEGLLGEISPIADSRVVEALLDACRRRDVAMWPRWLNSIDAAATDSTHAAGIQSLGERLCARLVEPNAPSVKSVRAAVEALQALAAHLPDDEKPNLTGVVAQALTPPVTDEQTAEQRVFIMQRVAPMVDADLVDRSELCKVLLPDLHQSFSAEFGAAVDKDSFLGRYLLHEAPAIIQDGAQKRDDGEEQVEQLLHDVQTSSWYEEPFKTELLLAVIAACGENHKLAEAAPTLAQIEALVEDLASQAFGAVEMWLPIARPGYEDLVAVISRLRADGPVKKTLSDAVAELRQKWSDDQLATFVRSQIVDPDIARLSETDVVLLGIRDLADGTLADILIERFAACHNNIQRRALIDLWSKTQISDDTARKRLIQTVVIGLLDGVDGSRAVGQTEIALDALNRLGKPLPYGTKGMLGQAVQRAVTGNQALERKAASVLEDLGYGTRRHGMFGLKKSIDYSG
ncbi:KAP family NTPase [Mycolicibacterium farcinogenes]|uniref:KAP family P-loop NTPase fold protein n=1 Tax=Mycolicibacterium farcinogenes TaxID=1802 RepID=UPI001C8EC433|nr:P-loop NTPase fold protein [Mycolicibacterium farcinogenes]QZH61019.1 KAP family NTPase [Mycolicibacterium farcinogenes]